MPAPPTSAICSPGSRTRLLRRFERPTRYPDTLLRTLVYADELPRKSHLLARLRDDEAPDTGTTSEPVYVRVSNPLRV